MFPLPLSLLSGLFSKYWLQILTVVLAVVLGWYVVDSIQTSAVRKNDEEWNARMKAMDEKANKVIDDLRENSRVLAENAQASSKAQAATIQQAITDLKKFKPDIQGNPPAGTFLEVRDGACKFTDPYVDSFLRIRNSLPGAN